MADNSYARAKVEVWEAFDGSISVYYQGHRLETRPAPAEASKMRELLKPDNLLKAPRKFATPSPDHPWRGKYRVHFDGKH